MGAGVRVEEEAVAVGCTFVRLSTNAIFGDEVHSPGTSRHPGPHSQHEEAGEEQGHEADEEEEEEGSHTTQAKRQHHHKRLLGKESIRTAHAWRHHHYLLPLALQGASTI